MEQKKIYQAVGMAVCGFSEWSALEKNYPNRLLRKTAILAENRDDLYKLAIMEKAKTR